MLHRYQSGGVLVRPSLNAGATGRGRPKASQYCVREAEPNRLVGLLAPCRRPTESGGPPSPVGPGSATSARHADLVAQIPRRALETGELAQLCNARRDASRSESLLATVQSGARVAAVSKLALPS